MTSTTNNEFINEIKRVNQKYNQFANNLEEKGFFEIQNTEKLTLNEEEKRFFKDRSPIFKIYNFDEESGEIDFYYQKNLQFD